jgi:hypothetical protein
MHIFHKWGKWEAFDVLSVDTSTGKGYEVTRQKRMCRKCGLLRVKKLG